MESPPSCSTWSEVFICSEDSGLLITSGSSCSVSLENQPNHFQFENSDFDDKSLSQADSLDDMSDIMCGENFNTLKKGHIMIDPPLEFQDKPILFKKYTNELAFRIIKDALYAVSQLVLDGKHKCTKSSKTATNLVASAWFSPARPSSRNSLGSNTGRLSCSHSSLATPSSARHPDDSNFITQAVSICELYSVPLDGGDVYAVPVDVVRNVGVATERPRPRLRAPPPRRPTRRSVAGLPPTPSNLNTRNDEPIHMTLQEVRQYLQTLHSSSSDSSDHRNNTNNKYYNNSNHVNNNNNNNKQKNRSSLQNGEKTLNRYKENVTFQNGKVIFTEETNMQIKNKKNNTKNKKGSKKQINDTENSENLSVTNKKCPVRSISSSLKQTLCNLFRWRKHNTNTSNDDGKDRIAPLASRALPPLPSEGQKEDSPQPKTSMDFASSIQKVKDYGWYWGPISSEAAERILLNEPDGSFIVRDSSDDHYIFSLTFRLQSGIRHVRIEHDQGNFSFGSCTRFKSHTIVEFIERAVEHSRSGRYLFFLHRRPLLGPMRVQLLHPVSRFKRVQSLQHMCRFVILKQVRKDKISELPLPRRIIDYLNTPHYYAEQLEDPTLNEAQNNAPQVNDDGQINQYN